MKKYFNNKKQAKEAAAERNSLRPGSVGVFRCPKGHRHSGKYAVCSHLEFISW